MSPSWQQLVIMKAKEEILMYIHPSNDDIRKDWILAEKQMKLKYEKKEDKNYEFNIPT